MQIYDMANKLAKEIRESDEYRHYSKIKKQVLENQDKKEKISNFEKLRYEMQLSQMKGENQDLDKMQELQNEYAKLINDEEIKEYFEAEIKFNVMIGDVNKIIAEAVKDVI